MRFLMLLLILTLISVDSVVIDESHTILKKSSYYKKAIENFKHFCSSLSDKKEVYVCRETFANQVFALPLYPYVHLLQLAKDKVYKHKDEVIAYFKDTHKLLVPTVAMTHEEIKQIDISQVTKKEKF